MNKLFLITLLTSIFSTSIFAKNCELKAKKILFANAAVETYLQNVNTNQPYYFETTYTVGEGQQMPAESYGYAINELAYFTIILSKHDCRLQKIDNSQGE